MDAGISAKYAWLSISEIKCPIPIIKDLEERLDNAEYDLLHDVIKAYKYQCKGLKHYDRHKLRLLLFNPYRFAYVGQYINLTKIGGCFERYNNKIDWIMRHGMAFSEGEIEFDPAKHKMLSPDEFLQIRDRLSLFNIPTQMWTYDLWREKIENILDLLSKGEVIDDVLMGEMPKMTRQQAGNVVWYIQEALSIIPNNDEHCFSICEECSTTFYTYDQGGESYCEDCERTLCFDCHPYDCGEEEE